MPARSRHRLFAALALLLILVAAAWLRIHDTLVTSLWLDEAYSVYAAEKGFGFLWAVVPTYETHPPFYYSLVRLWSLLFGTDVGAYRSLGILCGVTIVPLLLLAGRRAAETARAAPLLTGTVAAGLIAILPVAMTMSRQVRPYAVMMLVYAAAIHALLLLGQQAARDGRVARGPFALWLACLLTILWLHNLGVLYAGALGIGLVAMLGRPALIRRDWPLLVGGHLLVLLLWVPAIMILIDQAPTWVRSTWLTFEPDRLQLRLGQLYAVPGWRLWLAAGLAAAGVVMLVRTAEGARTAVTLLAAAILPVGIAIAVSATVSPIFIVRTMSPAAVPGVLLMALGVGGMRGLPRLAALAALVLLAAHMVRIDLQTFTYRGFQDWYRAVAWLGPRLRPGDRVLAYPNEGALPLDLALRDRRIAVPVDPVPVAVPAIGVGGWYPTGSRGVVSLPRDRLRAIARAPRVAATPTVWLLRLGPWAYDKRDMFLDELSRGRTEVGRYQDGPIDIRGLRITAPRAAPAAAAAAR